MERVSSQLTIFLRIALPTIWLTAILSLVVLLGFAVSGKAGLFANPFLWIILLIILGSGAAFIYFILWKFYRVDMDAKFIYVTDYFRTFRYAFEDVAQIRDSNVFPGRVFVIRLKSKGTFGREIHFLASQKLWTDFIREHPDLFEELYVREKN